MARTASEDMVPVSTETLAFIARLLSTTVINTPVVYSYGNEVHCTYKKFMPYVYILTWTESSYGELQ